MIGNLAQAISLVLMSSVMAIGGAKADEPKNVQPYIDFHTTYASDSSLRSIYTQSFNGFSNYYDNLDLSQETDFAIVYYNDSNYEILDTYSFSEMATELRSDPDLVCGISFTIDRQNYDQYIIQPMWRIYTIEYLTNYWFGWSFNTDNVASQNVLYYQLNLADIISLDYTQEYTFTPFYLMNGGSHPTVEFNSFSFTIGLQTGTPCEFSFFTLCGDPTSSTYYQGFDEGYTAGYGRGEADGYTQGYKNGYSEGLGTAGDAKFHNLFDAIADTPLRFLYGLFNFDLFGISCLVIVLSLLTATIVFALIKKIWK